MRIVSVLTVLAEFLLLSTGSTAQVQLDQSGLSGNLDITVIDSFGNTISAATLYVQHLSNSGDSARVKVDRLPVGPLDYGTYRVTAEKSGFDPASRLVGLHDPQATVVIALVVGEEQDGTVNVITGTLKEPNSAAECSLIRLTPLFAARPPSDAKLYKGKFQLRDVKPGKYAAVVHGGPKGVCRVSEVDIPQGQYQSVIVP
jgi:hypothetical protein